MNTRVPLVSCIVPVHNGAAFLAEALRSIASQADARTTSFALQMIVVDDGSTDDSARIAQGFEGAIVHSRAQGGVAAARNDGLALATGDYIGFLDADDLWLPGKLAAQVEMLAANPGADFCLSRVRHVTTGADGKFDRAMLTDAIAPAHAEDRLGRLMQCLLARRRAFEIVGGFDTGTKTRADQDWFLRAEARGLRHVVVDRVLTVRRIHGANHSLKYADNVLDDFLTIAKRNLDRKRQASAPPGPATPSSQ